MTNTHTTSAELTANQKKAMTVPIDGCLLNVGGTVVQDLEDEFYTLVSVDDLVSAGWSQKEAEGTFGSLVASGLIQYEVWEEGQYTILEDLNELQKYHA